MDFNELFNPNKPKLAAIIITLLALFAFIHTQLKLPVNGGIFLSVQASLFLTIIVGIPVSLAVFLLIGIAQGKMKG